MINIQSTMERQRKSERLTKEESKSLGRYVKAFPTIVDAAESIGIHRNVLDLVLIKGSGSPKTIGLVREKIKQTA